MPEEPEVNTYAASCAGVDLRHLEVPVPSQLPCVPLRSHSRTEQLRQLERAVRIVAQAEHIRRERAQLPDDLRRVGRGQHAALAGHQAGGQSDREAIAVAAEIEHVRAGGQARRQRAHVVQELRGADRPAAAIGHDRSGPVVRNERQRGHTGLTTPQAAAQRRGAFT